MHCLATIAFYSCIVKCYVGLKFIIIITTTTTTTIIIIIIITSMSRPGAWLSSRTVSTSSGLGLAGSQRTDQYSLEAGGLIQLSTATLSLVCQLDASSPSVARM